MVMRLLAVYCEVTIGYRGNRHRGYDTLCISVICFNITYIHGFTYCGYFLTRTAFENIA